MQLENALDQSSPLKKPKIDTKLIDEANNIFSDLIHFGWSKQKLENRLKWPNGFMSQLTLGRCSQDKAEERMPALRALHEAAEIAPGYEIPKIEVSTRALPIRRPLANGGVFDELVYAEKCRAELEGALRRAEERCLPILRLGLRAAINRVRDFRDEIRVG